MALKVAINGFGRIGRLTLRAIAENHAQEIQVVALNDLGPVESNAHLLKYDSVHGVFPYNVRVEKDMMDVGFGGIRVLSEPNPKNLPWGDMGVDLVLECSGHFTRREDAALHLGAGAKRVLISAPGEGADLTVVYGVNHHELTSGHHVVSNASCTTNCLAPVADVLHREIGIDHGFMTTIHAYTGDQRLVDTLHKDLRRARASGVSMIPTSTGAARAVGIVLPELKGKIDGTAIRVPTPNVSVVDFKFTPTRKTSVEEINGIMKTASEGRLKGILGVVDAPLVSIDFNHNPLSSSFDLTQTQVIQEKFCRVLSWYDNEWGFANRLVDTTLAMGSLL